MFLKLPLIGSLPGAGQECRTERFIQQKLNYIHDDPCKENKLVELPEQYEYSSAKFYL
jgi:hypothetical protein